MSASAVRSADLFRIASPAVVHEFTAFNEGEGWNPEAFAREQIRGLVRQLFFSSVARSVKQVIITPLDSETGVADLSRCAGEALAAETPGMVGVVTRRHFSDTSGENNEARTSTVRELPLPVKADGARLRSNLWFLNEDEILDRDRQTMKRPSIYSHLGELRREFEHSIVESRPASESSDAAILGQLADGIVLVLSARTTRRATARKVKQMLDSAGVQILGTVLSERIFPVPEAIYRRL